MTDSIIGIDCATQPKKTGLARAVRDEGGYRVVELTVGSADPHPVEVVAEWIGEGGTSLLAMDAPLGWPTMLGRGLGKHRAGEPIVVPGELLFRRLTDRVVADRTGKTPLEVGADRIARTAHSALLFLYDLRKLLNEPIPLAWETPLRQRVEVIEVYPAATMLARGASLIGYKKPEGVSERGALLETLEVSVDCSAVRDTAITSHDCLDAIGCVVAGIDFLRGEALPPWETDVAQREGWIWFRESTDPEGG